MSANDPKRTFGRKQGGVGVVIHCRAPLFPLRLLVRTMSIPITARQRPSLPRFCVTRCLRGSVETGRKHKRP